MSDAAVRVPDLSLPDLAPDGHPYAPAGDDGYRQRLSLEVGWTGASASVRLEGATHVEDELTRARELALLSAANSSDIVVRLTPADVFEWVSGATMELLGWRPDELLGRNKLTSSQARKRHLRPDGVLTKPLDSKRVCALVDEPSRVRT